VRRMTLSMDSLAAKSSCSVTLRTTSVFGGDAGGAGSGGAFVFGRRFDCHRLMGSTEISKMSGLFYLDEKFFWGIIEIPQQCRTQPTFQVKVPRVIEVS
jgi:hypothetical protein